MVSKFLQEVARVLARPDKRLADTNSRVLSYPSPHDVKVFSALGRYLLTGVLVKKVTAFVAQVAIKSHVCTTAD